MFALGFGRARGVGGRVAGGGARVGRGVLGHEVRRQLPLQAVDVPVAEVRAQLVHLRAHTASARRSRTILVEEKQSHETCPLM